MKASYKFALLGMLFSLHSCFLKKTTQIPTSSDLGVKWELISNVYQGKNQMLAQFTIYNHSKMVMENKGWEMYFSQLPPIPIIEDSVRMAKVVHINGDWFKLIPLKDFRLNPGDSIQIRYCGTGFNIKKTDAALGIYFVFYDANGKEHPPVPAGKQIIGEFTRNEQLTRTKEDETSIPTPQSRYQENLAISLLPDEQQQLIVPSPIAVNKGDKEVVIDEKWTIFYENSLSAEAEFLSKKLKELTGIQYKCISGTPSTYPCFSLQTKADQVKEKEGYQLTIETKSGMSVIGHDGAGVFYGIQSFLASLPIRFGTNNQNNITAKSLHVIDSPRFSYRGLQFDMARNFQSKETILKMLDLMAFYKLNKFLFYFMEDEGWRVEIPGLPELTDIGSQRMHCQKGDPMLHPSYGSGPFAKSEENYGSGFFTSAEFVEMLKFARERHITVIPVINFPAHVRSAIKAMEYRYQRLMREGKEQEANEFRLIDPQDNSQYISAQGYKDNVVCVARESVYHFYDTAVKGIKQMYDQAGMPMEIFHTGGDEVAQGCWSGSPMVHQFLTEHPEISKDEKSLQAYCFKRVSTILKQNGVKDIGGWEEAALLTGSDGKPTPNFEFVGKGLLPYLWNNTEGAEDLGYKLANAGYKVVLCDVSNFYLDFPYDKDPIEPGNYWTGFLETRNFYAFAPYDLFKTTMVTAMGRKIDPDNEFKDKVRLLPEARRNILGVQAQIWSETIKGEKMLEYYYLPRLIAFSETAWAKERKWENVQDRVLRAKQLDAGWNFLANAIGIRELPRLSMKNKGYNYRVPLPGAMIQNGWLYANVGFPGLEIRYTLDGSEPNLQSPIYIKPVQVNGKVNLKSFVKNGLSSRMTTL